MGRLMRFPQRVQELAIVLESDGEVLRGSDIIENVGVVVGIDGFERVGVVQLSGEGTIHDNKRLRVELLF